MGATCRAGVHGSRFNPDDYVSLGSLHRTEGVIRFDTDSLTVDGFPDGVLAVSESGLTPVAVFTFDDLVLAGAAVVEITGSRPLALLSKNRLTLDVAVSVDGSSASADSAGIATNGGFSGGGPGQAGIGPGGGCSHSADAGGGAGMGAAGGGGADAACGGSSYGDEFLTELVGGSGGGGGGQQLPGTAAGGAGGGALELAASRMIVITAHGGISLRGGDGASTAGCFAGGGGSGGAVLLSAPEIQNFGTIDVAGGGGGASLFPGGGNCDGGGGGAGGRVAFYANAVLLGTTLTAGGPGGTADDSGSSGQGGTVFQAPFGENCDPPSEAVEPLPPDGARFVNVALSLGWNGESPPRPDVNTTSTLGTPGCVSFGAACESSGGSNRFRGNVYRFLSIQTLTEIAAELDFLGPADLHFYVLAADQLDALFYPVLEQHRSTVGIGRGRYASGPIELQLSPGRFYAIGVAWPAPSIRHFRGPNSLPRDWTFGTIARNAQASLTPPFLGPVELSAFDTIAELAIELCLHPSGSCPTTYDVLMGTSSPPTFPICELSATPTCRLPELAPGTTYYWQVATTNAAGTSPSLVWTFTTLPCQTPAPPADPLPASESSGLPLHPILRWTIEPTFPFFSDDSDGPPQPADHFLSLECPASVLILDDYRPDGRRFAQDALDRLGISYTDVGDNQNEFAQNLNARSWDLIIIDLATTQLVPALRTWLTNYTAAGGPVIFFYGRLDQHEDLAAAFDAQPVGDLSTPLPVYAADPTHPLWNTPRALPLPLDEFVDTMTDNGDRLLPLEGGIPLAYFPADPLADDNAALVLGNRNKTLLHGFSPDENGYVDIDHDGTPDRVELWENEILFLLDLLPRCPTTYDVLLDTTDPPAAVRCQDVSSAACDPGPLASDTSYRWQVIARTASASTAGLVWSFSTTPCSPPSPPGDPFPSDAAPQAPFVIDLAWDQDAPEASPCASVFDVFLDTQDPPADVVCNGLDVATCHPPPLVTETTYHWQVIARNPAGTIAGPIWTFTTAPCPAPPMPSDPDPPNATNTSANDLRLRWSFQPPPHGGEPAAQTDTLETQAASVKTQVSDATAESFPELQGPLVSEIIESPGASWIRVLFEPIAPSAGAFVRVTSLLDGASQTLDAASLRRGQYSSAFFNGSRVLVERSSDAPGAATANVVISRVLTDQTDPIALTPCGPTDDRLPTDHRAVARLLTANQGVCTGWLVNACLLTAGHCFSIDTVTVAQFNVPTSNPATGTLVHPPPQDQYAIDPDSIQFDADGHGKDWGVFGCFANPLSGLTPFQRQRAKFELADAIPPADDQPVSVIGHGRDFTPRERNFVQQTASGPLRIAGGSPFILDYEVDTDSGTSGAPVVLQSTGQVIGIHNSGLCDVAPPPYNRGTPITFPPLRMALQVPQGVCSHLDPCPITYDVMLDPSTPPESVVCSGIDVSQCVAGPLQSDAVYYWRVVASTAEQRTFGPIWSFQTLSCGAYAGLSPHVAPAGCRALTITPAPGPHPVAIRLAGQPTDPHVSCILAYLQPNGALDQVPFFQPPSQWGDVTVLNDLIRPRASYTIEMLCRDGDQVEVGLPVGVQAARLGDATLDGDVNAEDVLCLLNALHGQPVTCSPVAMNMNPCLMDGVINLDDLMATLDAFAGLPAPCDSPCP